ncbi:MAG: hypothetical protein ACREJO_02555 [Phycisphaerales bacterium]
MWWLPLILISMLTLMILIQKRGWQRSNPCPECGSTMVVVDPVSKRVHLGTPKLLLIRRKKCTAYRVSEHGATPRSARADERQLFAANPNP